MKIKVGDKLDSIILPSIDGGEFNTSSIENKKLLITFYRFASCPMCNLRLNNIVKNYDQFGENFTMVAIFNSPVENLKRFTKKHQAPFPILADKDYHYFKKYDVKKSFFIFLISQITRGLSIWKAMFKGFIPWTFKGYLGILPVDVLIDESGIVQDVKYGKDIADHFSFDKIVQFSKS